MFVRRHANNHQGMKVWKKRRSSPLPPPLLPLPYPPSPQRLPAPSSDEGEGVLGGVLGAAKVAAYLAALLRRPFPTV